jgi:hypothetical protein
MATASSRVRKTWTPSRPALPGSGAGGYDEAVEGDGLTVAQDHGPRIEVETGRPLPQLPLDIELVKVGTVAEERLLRLPLAVEDLLG